MFEWKRLGVAVSVYVQVGYGSVLILGPGASGMLGSGFWSAWSFPGPTGLDAERGHEYHRGVGPEKSVSSHNFFPIKNADLTDGYAILANELHTCPGYTNSLYSHRTHFRQGKRY